MKQRLTKSSTDSVVDGVAGGIAEYFGVDPVLVRLVFVLLFVSTGGTLVLGYIALMIIMPSEDQATQRARDVMRTNAESLGERVRAVGDEVRAELGDSSEPTESRASTDQADWTGPDGEWRAEVERVAQAADTASATRAPATTTSSRDRSRQLGILLIVVGAVFLAREVIHIDSSTVAAAALIVIGAVVLMRRTRAAR
jgi:phage shock protein C